MINFDTKNVMKRARGNYTRYDKYAQNKAQLLYNFLVSCHEIYLYGDIAQLQKECNGYGIEFNEKYKVRAILRLTTQWWCVKNKKILNGKIKTYARALKNLEKKGLDEKGVYEKLEQYGVDYWANKRSKKKDNSDDKKTSKTSSSRRWTPTIKFNNVFKTSTIKNQDFVTLKLGDKVTVSTDSKLIEAVKAFSVDFLNVDDVFKKVVKQRNGEE